MFIAILRENGIDGVKMVTGIYRKILMFLCLSVAACLEPKSGKDEQVVQVDRAAFVCVCILAPTITHITGNIKPMPGQDRKVFKVNLCIIIKICLGAR